MHTWQLACFYLQRKKTRAFLLALVLSLIASSLYASLAIKRQTIQLRDELAKLAAGSFHIANQMGNTFSQKQAQLALPKQQISTVNWRYEKLVMSKQLKTFTQSQSIQLDKATYTQKLFNVIALSASELANEFKSGGFQLVKGRHLTVNDHRQIMLHEDLAKKNGLKVGDKVSLQALKQLDNNGQKPDLYPQQEYEIVGLFKGLINLVQQGLSSDLSENTLFMAYKGSQDLINAKDSNNYIAHRADCYLEKDADLASVKKNVQANLAKHKELIIGNNNSVYAQTESSLASMQGLLNAMTLAIILASSLVLAFLLIMHLRERIQEIGIRLALGASKVKISQQFIWEMFYLSCAAIIVTAFLGPLVQSLLSQGLQKFLSSSASLDALRQTQTAFIFKLSLPAFIGSYGLLLLIILLVNSLTLTVYLNQTPKQILSKMS